MKSYVGCVFATPFGTLMVISQDDEGLYTVQSHYSGEIEYMYLTHEYLEDLLERRSDHGVITYLSRPGREL